MMKTCNKAFNFTWPDGRCVYPPAFSSNDIVPDPSFFLDRARNVDELFDRCCYMFAEYSYKLRSWGYQLLPDDIERRNEGYREGKELKGILLSLAVWIHEAVRSKPDVLFLCQAQQLPFALLADDTATIVRTGLGVDRPPIQKRCDSLGERISKYSKEIRKALAFGTVDLQGLMRTYSSLHRDIVEYQDRVRVEYRAALDVGTISPAVLKYLHVNGSRLSQFERWLERCLRSVARVSIAGNAASSILDGFCV